MPFGPRSGSHPWRVRADPKLKARWAAARRPCARCGGAIDYGQAYWVKLGKRTVMHPRAYVEGHVVSLATAARLGWTREQANAPSNKQPECATCSRRSGARQGRALQTQRRVITSREW